MQLRRYNRRHDNELAPGSNGVKNGGDQMAQATLNRILDDIKTLDPEELRKVEQAIHARMPAPNALSSTEPTLEQIEAANALLRETIVTLSYATGADNDSIDADLAREYGADHADFYRSDDEK
jgi:hypothetical protein